MPGLRIWLPRIHNKPMVMGRCAHILDFGSDCRLRRDAESGEHVDSAKWGRGQWLLAQLRIFLLMTLYIFRAAGRIDPGYMSRLGLTSVWALSLLLPILLIAAYGKSRLTSILLTCTFSAAILSPYFSQIDLMSAFHEKFPVLLRHLRMSPVGEILVCQTSGMELLRKHN